MSALSGPSLLATACAVSLATGFLLGQAFPLNLWNHRISRSRFRSRSHPHTNSHSSATSSEYDSASVSDSDSDSGSDSDSDSSSEFTPVDPELPFSQIPGECRMALIVRTDLKMSKGKAAAQCAHAALACYKNMLLSGSPEAQALLRRWERGGQAKITLSAPSSEDLDMLFAQAMSLGINARVIHDAGRTQIAAGSATVLGLGPAPKSVLDQVTGELKLY